MISLLLENIRTGTNGAVALVLSGLTLAGCATFDVPDRVETRSALIEETAKQNLSFDTILQERAPVMPDWWRSFGDPVLVDLVETALMRNRSLEAARFNLNAADALLVRAELNRSYSTSTGAGLTFENRNAASAINTNLSGDIGASWEPDLFGRIDAQIRLQGFNRDAAAQSRRDIAVAVTAQTAQAYIDLRGAEKRLEVAERSTELQSESLELLRELVDAGRSNDLDLSRAESLFRTTLASLPTFRAQIETSQARLSALSAGRANLPESIDTPIPAPDGLLNVGSVEALIRRRPDIRLAEARMSERLAFGDLERSRIFPRITLGAGINTFFGTFGNGAQISNVNTTIGPALSWEGPDLRGVRADIAASDAQTRAAVATYEQTVLNALADVQSSLSLYQREFERRENLLQAERSAEDALDLARLRFEEGLDDFLDVLDAQRTLLSTRDDRVQNDISIATAAISAYRALGGMWTDEELRTLAIAPETERLAP